MFKNLRYVVYLLVSVLLIAGYFFIFNTSSDLNDISSQKQLLNESVPLSPSYELDNIEEELERIIKDGGHINPQRYNEIDQEITELIEKGVDQEKGEHVLSLLSQLKVGETESESEEEEVVVVESNSAPNNADNSFYVQNLEEVPQDFSNEVDPQIEVQETEVREQGYDMEFESRHLSYIGPLPQPSSSCKKNRNPVFTHHITDVSKIDYVALPPTIGKSPDGSSQLKTHSYIGTNSDRAPLYAPADMVLDNGAHYIGGPYWLGFEVSCEIRLRFAHITDPVQKIKEVFPAEPNISSENHKSKYKVSFKAGELIGYASGTNGGGNWDFGVYDLLSRNRYAENSEYGWVFSTAVCPFDYYSEEMRSAYSDKFNTDILEGNPLDGESFCK